MQLSLPRRNLRSYGPLGAGEDLADLATLAAIVARRQGCASLRTVVVEIRVSPGQGYSTRRPLIAREITSCWICSVPSKMS